MITWRTAVLDRDRGYATITAAGIIVAVVSVALVVIGACSHVVGAHRAQVAADLSAVAAATAVFVGNEPCTAATDTASANGAKVTSCTLDGADATVEVAVGRARAKARAGPIDEAPG